MCIIPLLSLNFVFSKSRQFSATVGPVKSVTQGRMGWKLGSPSRRPGKTRRYNCEHLMSPFSKILFPLCQTLSMQKVKQIHKPAK